MALRFKAVREQLGLDQQAVADGTGLSRATVSRIERGEIDYSGKTLRRFADFFGCDPGDLISDRPLPADGVTIDRELMAKILHAVERQGAENDPPIGVEARGYLVALIYEFERRNPSEEFDFADYADLVKVGRRHRLTGLDRMRQSLEPHGLRFADDAETDDGGNDQQAGGPGSPRHN